jgi:hypothetical protein
MTTKYTKEPLNKQNGLKMDQMVIKCTSFSHCKIYPNWDFRFENNHLATLHRAVLVQPFYRHDRCLGSTWPLAPGRPELENFSKLGDCLLRIIFLATKVAQILRYFCNEKSNFLLPTKTGLGDILGDFFTAASGHHVLRR